MNLLWLSTVRHLSIVSVRPTSPHSKHMNASKRFGFLAAVVTLAGFLRPFSQELHSQPTFDALTFGPGINVVGVCSPPPGWTFVPTTDLRVVAVGCLPESLREVEVRFWAGTNQVIGSYLIEAVPEQGYIVAYQPADLTLKAGAPYSISIWGDGIGVQMFQRQSYDGTATFSTSPFISHFACFQVWTNNNVWSPWPSALGNSDMLSLGPTFQFQVLRQLCLCVTNATLILSWPTQSVSYAIQQSADITTPIWVTLTNAPVVAGSNNEIAIPEPGGTRFFRLVSQ
jgi:hypothetical protein